MSFKLKKKTFVEIRKITKLEIKKALIKTRWKEELLNQSFGQETENTKIKNSLVQTEKEGEQYIIKCEQDSSRNTYIWNSSSGIQGT